MNVKLDSQVYIDSPLTRYNSCKEDWPLPDYFTKLPAPANAMLNAHRKKISAVVLTKDPQFRGLTETIQLADTLDGIAAVPGFETHSNIAYISPYISLLKKRRKELQEANNPKSLEKFLKEHENEAEIIPYVTPRFPDVDLPKNAVLSIDSLSYFGDPNSILTQKHRAKKYHLRLVAGSGCKHHSDVGSSYTNISVEKLCSECLFKAIRNSPIKIHLGKPNVRSLAKQGLRIANRKLYELGLNTHWRIR